MATVLETHLPGAHERFRNMRTSRLVATSWHAAAASWDVALSRRHRLIDFYLARVLAAPLGRRSPRCRPTSTSLPCRMDSILTLTAVMSRAGCSSTPSALVRIHRRRPRWPWVCCFLAAGYIWDDKV